MKNTGSASRRRIAGTNPRESVEGTSAAMSVPEVPAAREDHRQAVLVSGGDNVSVFDRPAGLHDRRGAGGGDRIEAVAKRKERVGRRDRAAQAGAGPPHGPLD